MVHFTHSSRYANQREEQWRGMSRKTRRIWEGSIAAVALFLALAAGVYAVINYISIDYALVNGRLVPRYALTQSLTVTDSYPEHFSGMTGLERLNMRGSTVTDFSLLFAKTKLTQLDVRDNPAFTPEIFSKARRTASL